MNAHTSGCDHQRIDDFLNSDHVGIDDSQLVDHLDSCAACREYMEGQAAEPERWSEAAEILQPGEFDHAGSAEFSAATIGYQRVAQPAARLPRVAAEHDATAPPVLALQHLGERGAEAGDGGRVERIFPRHGPDAVGAEQLFHGSSLPSS